MMAEQRTSRRSHDGVEDCLPVVHRLPVEKRLSVTIILGDAL